MATTSRAARSRPWRSASSIPVRDARDAQPDRGTHTRRIPLAKPQPHVPWGDFRPKAFAGEVVPFVVTAFREGHARSSTLPPETFTGHPTLEVYEVLDSTAGVEA